MKNGYHATTEKNIEVILKNGILSRNQMGEFCEPVYENDIWGGYKYPEHVIDLIKHYRCNGVYFISETSLSENMDGLLRAGKQSLYTVMNKWIKYKENELPTVIHIKNTPNKAVLDPESHPYAYINHEGNINSYLEGCNDLKLHNSMVYEGIISPDDIDYICTFKDEFYNILPDNIKLGEFLGKNYMGEITDYESRKIYNTFFNNNDHILNNLDCKHINNIN